MTTQQEIDEWFSTPEFVGLEPGRIDRIRTAAKSLAGTIVACCKPGSTRDSALIHLRVAVMLCERNLHNAINVALEEDDVQANVRTLPAPPALPKGVTEE